MSDMSRPWAFAVVAGVAFALHLLLSPSLFLPAILVLILVLGMPHGALDLSLARRTWPIIGPARYAAFLAGYLAIAAAVVLVWFLAPDLALIAFLGYSAFHFADDWPAPKHGAVAAGVVILALPAVMHPDRVDMLFDWLGADGSMVRQGLAAAGLIAVCVATWAYRVRLATIGILVGFVPLAWLLPPLGYFFVYFCGLHAPGHVRRVSRRLQVEERFLRREMLVPTTVSLLAIAAGAAALLVSGVEPGAAGMRATFIAFAALTVPHMVLVDVFSRSAPKRQEALYGAAARR